MDVITSRVEYRSSLFIKTVFEATFSFSNILRKIVRTRFLQCFFFTLTKQCNVSRFESNSSRTQHTIVVALQQMLASGPIQSRRFSLAFRL